VVIRICLRLLFKDLIFIEEAFERLMLDYDRVFSSMGIPACLWRRTGEIYKGNHEFAELVGVEASMLRDVSLLGRIPSSSLRLNVPSEQGGLCIYELMAEESAVNYWEVRLISPPSYQSLTGWATRNMETSHSTRRRRRC